jgi:hypothetical protein
MLPDSASTGCDRDTLPWDSVFSALALLGHPLDHSVMKAVQSLGGAAEGLLALTCCADAAGQIACATGRHKHASGPGTLTRAAGCAQGYDEWTQVLGSKQHRHETKIS